VLKNGTRILRPSEVRILMDHIPKIDLQTKFEALLYSGARYSEMRWLYKHQKAFKKTHIQMPSFKNLTKMDERFIRLNKSGQKTVDYFLRSQKNLPKYRGWQINLKNWCKKAGLSTQGIGVKTTRKTWESWLVTMYPRDLERIFLSQGHDQMTALKFYLMLPFTDTDIEEMKYFTDGWL